MIEPNTIAEWMDRDDDRLNAMADTADQLGWAIGTADLPDEDYESLSESEDFESQHPRGKGGRFVNKQRLEAAKTNPAVAAQLRREVTKPEERAKLDKIIGKAPADSQGSGHASGHPSHQEKPRGKPTPEHFVHKIQKVYAELTRLESERKAIEAEAAETGLPAGERLQKLRALSAIEASINDKHHYIRAAEIAHKAAAAGNEDVVPMAHNLVSETGNPAMKSFFEESLAEATAERGGGHVPPRLLQSGYIAASESSRVHLKRNVIKRLGKKLDDAVASGEIAESDLHATMIDLLATEWSHSQVAGESYENARDRAEKTWKDLSNKSRSEIVIETLMDSWARSSTDHNPTSLALQVAVDSVFGKETGDIRGSDPFFLKNAKTLYSDNKTVLDAVVRQIYRDTQQRLEDAGIKEVTLFRGMWMDPKAETTTIESVGLNPISSFAMDYATAEEFGTVTPDKKKEYRGAILSVVVPRESILTTSGNGFGCLTQSEILVAGAIPLRGKLLVEDKHGKFPKHAVDYVDQWLGLQR